MNIKAWINRSMSCPEDLVLSLIIPNIRKLMTKGLMNARAANGLFLSAGLLLFFLALPAYGDGQGANNSSNATSDEFGINGGAGGGGAGGGKGGLGSNNVAAGANGGTFTGGAGSGGNAVQGGTPGTGGIGGSAGNAANPQGGTGGNGGNSVCNGQCAYGNGAGGGGGGGAGFAGYMANVLNAITGGNGGNGGNATDGTDVAGADGGGGGGGGTGLVESSGVVQTTTVASNISGGRGGNGGKAFGPGGAGIGGGGGSAIDIRNIKLLINQDIKIQGGDGGTGGDGSSGGGPATRHGRIGGPGGAGITANDSTITIDYGSFIQGGNGGISGIFAYNPDSPALGGAGIQGGNIDIINGGNIYGGTTASRDVRANSVLFDPGFNSLQLIYGWTFDGNVGSSNPAANFGSNRFILGGDTTELTRVTTGSQFSTIFDVSQFGAKYKDFSSFAKTGASLWRLLGAASQLTPWTIYQGTLSINNNNNLGADTGRLTLSGGTLQFNDNLTLPAARAVSITADGGAIDTQGYTATIAGGMTGYQLSKTGTGTLILTGSNTYNGTTIEQGTLQLGTNGATGSISGNVSLDLDTSTLSFNHSNTLVYNGVMSGAGVVKQLGSGMTVLTGDNSYTGGTTISSGTLRLGNDGATGSIAGDVTNNGTLEFDRSDQLAMDGTIAGAGSVKQTGDGVTVLSANNSYAGTTTLSAGQLYINGNQTTATGATQVDNGATLGGEGMIGGSVAIGDGGALSPGGAAEAAIGTLTINQNLALGGNAILNYGFDQHDEAGGAVNDLTVVGNNLTLDGTINASLTPGSSLSPGIYRIIDYAGTLTDRGLSLGAMPAGATFYVQTSVSNQVNLVNTTGLTLNYWDGAAAANKNDDKVNGGDGEWQADTVGNDHWTVVDGTVNAPWTKAAFAIFQGMPGTVTVDNALGQVSASGLQFAADGYVLNGQPLTLVETNSGTGQTIVRVGDDTKEGAADSATISAILQGDSQLVKTDLGTLVLTGNNSYTGGTAIDGGTLRVGSDDNLGAATGGLSFDGGTLANSADVTSARATRLDAGGGTFDIAADTVLTLSGIISGANAEATLTKTGAGTLTLTGENTYAGDTLVQAGTLQLGDGANRGSIENDITVADDTTLVFNRDDISVYNGVLSGAGEVKQSGAGTTVFTGDNSYTGLTTVADGALQLGDGGATGSISGDVENNATLNFNRINTLDYGGTISGTGSVNQLGNGATVLSADNSYTGATTVSAGKLYINGDQTAATGATLVDGGATLAGEGIVGGSVTVGDNGVLAPGGATEAAIGKLTIRQNLMLGSGAILDYNFGQANVVGGPFNDLTVVGGDLTLGGVINVIQTPGSAFDAGIYRIINYDGTLLDQGLSLGEVPPATVELVQTSVSNQVNLINTTGLTLNYWDGAAAGNINNHAVNGGDGDWQAATVGNDHWTLFDGSVNAPWTDAAFAIFQGTPGVVTVDNSLGQVSASGLQFAANGYVVNGAPLSLVETRTGTGQTIIRVGDGTVDGAADIATINAILQGATQVVKTDLGTLILTGDNTYTGGTAINGGTVRVTDDGNLGAATGGLSFAGGTLANTVDFTSARTTQLNAGGGTFDVATDTTMLMSGVISGANVAGTLTKAGAGTLTLTGENTYAGDTLVAAGALQLGNGAGSGAIAGNAVLAPDSKLVFNRDNTLIYGGAISGAGTVGQIGSGMTVLTGDSSYTGLTTLSAGALQLGNGGATGSIGGNVINNATLNFNRSNQLNFGGAISGTGLVNQMGNGVTVLTSANTYSGGTNIMAGTLQLGNGGESGSISGNVTDNGTLAFNRSDSADFDGIISGSGGVSQIGAGATVLTQANGYTGATRILAGTLQAGALNVLSPGSIITVADSATLALNSLSQVIGGLNNGGLVSFSYGSGPSASLTVKGNYAGNNGVIAMNTLLGKDNSPSDQLIIDGGQASGKTALLIKSGGSEGGATDKGIDIVTAINGATTAAGSFYLDPGSDGYSDNGTISAGAYDYFLKRGGNGGQAEDWYLLSQISPAMDAYLDNRMTTTTLQIHSLHDRQWQVPGMEDSYSWLRMEGTAIQYDENGQTSDDNLFILHGGSDIARFSDGHDGSLRVGVMGEFATSSGTTKADLGKTDHSVQGYSGGAYTTWYGNHDIQIGPYVDSWLLYGKFDNSVASQGQPTENYRSRAMTTSIESGYSFKLSDTPTVRFYLEPQAQLIYSDYRADDHTLAGGSQITDLSGDGITTRLGVRLNEVRLDDKGQAMMQPFVELNWWHGPSSQTMRVDQLPVSEKLPANRGEFKFGVKGDIRKDVSITGSLGVDTNLSSYTAGSAMIGASYRW